MVFLFWSIEDLRIAQSYVKCFFLSIFSSGGPFTHDFGRIQVQMMPYFTKIKIVYFLVICLII